MCCFTKDTKNLIIIASTALHNQLKRAASLDLVIMLDTTGSMQKYLTDIQTHIMSLVTAVGNLHPDSSLRLAFVGYHHVQDGRQVAQKFTSDLSVFSSVLKHVNVSGGGFDDYLADVTGKYYDRGRINELLFIFYSTLTHCRRSQNCSGIGLAVNHSYLVSHWRHAMPWIEVSLRATS